jgi:hypothetical protein
MNILNYKGITKFKVTDYNDEFDMIILIDFDFKKDGIDIEKILKDQVLFWSGGERDIEFHDGDYVKVYLMYLANLVKEHSRDYNIDGVKDKIKEAEGYYPVDGSWGITLLKCSLYENDDFEIEVIE